MTIPPDIVDQVRRRADFACEYCGVTETDSGGRLSVDHFKPRAHGGADTLDNLLYCCHRCNLYKADYWPLQPHAPALWNPRQEARRAHLLGLADGTLYPTTPTGSFTLKRLRLNRPPLVAYRLQRQSQVEEHELLQRYREVIGTLERLQRQQADLLQEHRALLDQQRALLRLLLRREE
jgi:hypothetical protein